MGPDENMNKELCGLVRCFRIYEIESEAGNNDGLSTVAVVGQTKFGRFGTRYPRPLISRNSTIAGTLLFGWRSRTEAMSTSSDWRMMCVLGTISSTESRRQALE